MAREPPGELEALRARMLAQQEELIRKAQARRAQWVSEEGRQALLAARERCAQTERRSECRLPILSGAGKFGGYEAAAGAAQLWGGSSAGAAAAAA